MGFNIVKMSIIYWVNSLNAFKSRRPGPDNLSPACPFLAMKVWLRRARQRPIYVFPALFQGTKLQFFVKKPLAP